MSNRLLGNSRAGLRSVSRRELSLSADYAALICPTIITYTSMSIAFMLEEIHITPCLINRVVNFISIETWLSAFISISESIFLIIISFAT